MAPLFLVGCITNKHTHTWLTVSLLRFMCLIGCTCWAVHSVFGAGDLMFRQHVFYYPVNLKGVILFYVPLFISEA